MTPTRANPDTRNRLLQAGVEAFLREGYHGAGLKAILDQVDVPKGSFYNYFKSKEDFASASIDYYAVCIAGRLEAALNLAESPLQGLRRFFEQQVEEYEEKGLAGGCLVANLGAELDDSPLCREALQSAVDSYLRSLSAALQSAQDADQVRGDIPACTLASLMSDSWEGALIRMKIQQSTKPLHQVITSFFEGFLVP